MLEDGITLTNVAHPRTPGYRRIWFALRRPRLSPGSLEPLSIRLGGNVDDKEIYPTGRPQMPGRDIEGR